jgi:hypothetical protein
MYYEPDTIWGRTVQGDLEVTTPTSGLSLVQRRLLKRLARPKTFATLVARDRVEPPRLEHELIRLAELRLVAYKRPGTTQPRTAPQINLSLQAQSVASRVANWRPPPAVYLAAVALGIGTVLLLVY